MTIKCEITKAIIESKRDGTDMCLVCKGSRLLCGKPYCPLLYRINTLLAKKQDLEVSNEFFGPSPPSIFVGRYGYPKVSIGPMSALSTEEVGSMDDPSKWYGKDFDEIIRIRSNLLRARSSEDVRSRSRIISDSQELALSIKPTDIEITFKHPPRANLSFSSTLQPMGPEGELQKLRIAENTRIPRTVDRIVSDEVMANRAISTLFERGYDVYYLSQVLSSGVLGGEDRKRLVPTRWSITAVDDIVAKELISKIRDYPTVNEFLVYSNTYLDNHFEILLMPGSWEFENFEAWAPRTLWTANRREAVIQVEGEPYTGRSKYAEKEGGGYYAARLGVVEALARMGRQARVVSFREIYEGYVLPVGVWEVRENVRKAMEKKPEHFSTKREALEYLSSRLRVDIGRYIGMSGILGQSRLVEFGGGGGES